MPHIYIYIYIYIYIHTDLAKDARAASKIDVLELAEHRRHSARRDDVARVHQPIEKLGRSLNRVLQQKQTHTSIKVQH